MSSTERLLENNYTVSQNYFFTKLAALLSAHEALPEAWSNID